MILKLELTPEQLENLIEQKVAEALANLQASPQSDWLRGAAEIGDYIGCSRQRIYNLSSRREIPVHREGSTLLARRSELDAWIQDGRP